MKRLYLTVAIVGVAATALAISFYAGPLLTTPLDPSECRRIASEQNRWEFCGTVPIPVMTMVVLGENATGVIDYESQFGNRFGEDCAGIPDCDVLTYSRVVQPAEPISIHRHSDVIFLAEGKFQPTNMTIEIQEFSPFPGNTIDADEASVVSVENIIDTSFTLEDHQPASYLAPNDPSISTSFRYSINNLPNGYFILNAISKWDADTLQQDQGTVTLHRFKVRVTE